MAKGKSFSSSRWSRSSNISSRGSSSSRSSSSSSSKGKSFSSTTSRSNAARSAWTASIWNRGSSSSTGKSWANTSASKWISSWSNAASKLTSSINRSSGGSSSWSSSKSTGKSISSVTSRWTTARNNLTSSARRSWGGSSSSSWGSSSSSSSGITSRSALTEAINRAVNNKNSSISSNWWNTVISTKSDTNKLIPGTSIKGGGRTNTQVYDENWNLISDIDEYWKWLWQDEIDNELLWAQSNDDEDEEYSLNPNEDTIWWEEDEGNEGNYMSEEDIMNMVDNAVNERDNYRQENMNDLREKYENNEAAEPSKSAEEQRLETPAFNQFSWNSFVENRPAELSPVNVPNPNDPLTDPSSYDEPITQALNKLWLDLWEQTPQQVDNVENTQAVNTAEWMPEYNGDINSTMQWYTNVFNNIENQWVNARTARQFAQAYNKAKLDIQNYAQDNWLSQEEYERLLAQLRSHPLIQDLSNNQNQWRR